MIQIAPSDRHFCTSCNYIAGVYNHGPGKARFTVSSTSEHHTETLVEGLAAPGVVNEGAYEYYRLVSVSVYFLLEFPQLTFDNKFAAGY